MFPQKKTEEEQEKEKFQNIKSLLMKKLIPLQHD